MSNHILAIGISKHQVVRNNLTYAAKDAEDFYSLFVNNVSDLGYKKLLLDSEATLSQIRSSLGKDLISAVKPGDSFFFYYSGHGTTALEADGTTLAHYLVPFDATQDISSSCISVSYLQEVFKRLPSKAKIIFIDSCFSGALHNTKGFDILKKKSVKPIKSFANTVSGTGQVTFTACKESEEAIEDTEYKNGLFTHFLIDEMVKARHEKRFSITEITTPIQEAVTTRATKSYQHNQTPTFSGHLEGPIYLPVFAMQLTKDPYLPSIPELSALVGTPFPVSSVRIDSIELDDSVSQITNLVIKAGSSQIDAILLERTCYQSVKHIKKEWERIYLEVGADITKIPWAVNELESAAYQFLLIGGVISAFGSEDQMKIYAKCLAEILSIGQSQSGLVALLAVPEVLVAEANYIVGLVALERDRLHLFKALLLTPVIDDRQEDGRVMPLVLQTHVYYTDALGRASSKVNDHIREFLKSLAWLPYLAPSLEGKTDDFQMRVNFLLVILTGQHKDYLWPDFARFNAERIRPLAGMIKNDPDYQQKVANFLGVTQSDLLFKIQESLENVYKHGLQNFWWNSITPGFFEIKTS